MATSNTLRKIGQVLSGAFLGLTGSWLLIICLGGLITFGALSVFHLGVLLSLGCIGLCLLVAGACWLYGTLAYVSPKKMHPALAAEAGDESPQDDLKKHATIYTAPFQSCLNRQRNTLEGNEPKKHCSSQSTYHPLN